MPLALDDPFLLTFAGGLLMAAGIAIVRHRWLSRGARGVGLLAGGWIIVLAAFAVLGAAWGAEMGTTYAIGLLSLIAYTLIAVTYERRSAKIRNERETANDPAVRSGNWKRGIVKSLLAVVLAGVAAIGIGVALAVALPLPPQDRAVIGGLMVPILWGGGMAWALSDPRLVRATLILLVISAAGYGIAFLPKVLS
mgnify:CR=1 FL=1